MCWQRWITAPSIAVFVFGCTPTLVSRGYPLTAETLIRVQHGMQTRDTIRAMLGTPSFAATFGDETWYYIWSREMQFAFHLPTELERKVIAIHFNSSDLVREVSTYSLANGNTVELIKRVTPTTGKKISLLQQLLSNIGRFSRPRKEGT